MSAVETQTLTSLSEDERNARFDDLQTRLPGVWRLFGLNEPGESVVVVPSVSLDKVTSSSGTSMQAMEERYLFLLLLLRQPRTGPRQHETSDRQPHTCCLTEKHRFDCRIFRPVFQFLTAPTRPFRLRADSCIMRMKGTSSCSKPASSTPL